jgi:hypothetical protein
MSMLSLGYEDFNVSERSHVPLANFYKPYSYVKDLMLSHVLNLTANQSITLQFQHRTFSS